jgi:hypothetical protein
MGILASNFRTLNHGCRSIRFGLYKAVSCEHRTGGASVPPNYLVYTDPWSNADDCCDEVLWDRSVASQGLARQHARSSTTSTPGMVPKSKVQAHRYPLNGNYLLFESNALAQSCQSVFRSTRWRYRTDRVRYITWPGRLHYRLRKASSLYHTEMLGRKN